MGFLDKLIKAADSLSKGASTDPQVRVIRQGNGSRTLDFSACMDAAMKNRIKRGELEWMDKVEIFEGMYLPLRQKQGWVQSKGGRGSSNDDRFKIQWDIDGETIVGSYDDQEFTVTERIKKSRK